MRLHSSLPLLLLALTPTLHAATLADEVQAFLSVPAVSGRERPAADFIAGRLAGSPVSRDSLGDVVLTVGSGEPRRLVACALGEPGFIVSDIQEDGYLRVVPAGGPVGALWTQSFEGQTVVIGGAQGWRAGGVVLPSVHLQQGAKGLRERPFSAEDVYIDAGAGSAAEVAALGIRLMDPVALIRRPQTLAGGLAAAPAAAQKGACAALAAVARGYRQGSRRRHRGLRLDGLRRPQSLRAPARRPRAGAVPGRDPDGPGVRSSAPQAGLRTAQRRHAAGGLPEPPDRSPPGAGPRLRRRDRLETGPRELPGASRAKPGDPGRDHRPPRRRDARGHPAQGARAGGARSVPGPPLPPPPAILEPATGHGETARLLASLVARYGVSGAEGPVREEVLRSLPAWAKPETDAKGNVTVTVGTRRRSHPLRGPHGRGRLPRRGGAAGRPAPPPGPGRAHPLRLGGAGGPGPRRPRPGAGDLRAPRGLVEGRERPPRRSAARLPGGLLRARGRGARRPRRQHGHHAEADAPHRPPSRPRPRLRRPGGLGRPDPRPAEDRSRPAPPEGDLRLVGRGGGGAQRRPGASPNACTGSPRSTPSTPSSPPTRPSNPAGSPAPGSATAPCCGPWTTAISPPGS